MKEEGTGKECPARHLVENFGLCEMKKLHVGQGLLAGVFWALLRDEVMIHLRHECSAGNKTSP